MTEVGTGEIVRFPITGEIYIGQVIRSGGSSFVYEAFDSHQNRFAIKIIRANAKDDGITQRVENEISNPLPQSSHIVKPIEHVIIESFGLKIPCILFEYVASKEVADYLTHNEPTKEGLSRRLTAAKNMAMCIQHVHDFGYTHGDISPKNFLLDDTDDSIRMIDFETLSVVGGEPLVRSWANKDYMAPEVDQHGPVAISQNSDVWSFGLLLIEWLSPQVWKQDNFDEGWAKKFNHRKMSSKSNVVGSILESKAPSGLKHIWPWITSALSIDLNKRQPIELLIQIMEGEER